MISFEYSKKKEEKKNFDWQDFINFFIILTLYLYWDDDDDDDERKK